MANNMQRGGMRNTHSTKQSMFIGRRSALVEDGTPLLYPRYRDVAEILLDGSKAPAPAQAPPVARRVAAPVAVQPQYVAPPAVQTTPVATPKPAGKFVHPHAAVAAAQPTAQDALLARAQVSLQSPAGAATSVPLSADAVAAVRAADGTAEKKKPKRDKNRKRESTEITGVNSPAHETPAKKAKKERKARQALLEPAERVSGPGNADEATAMRAALGISVPAVATTPAAAAPIAAPVAASAPQFSFAFAPSPVAAPSAAADYPVYVPVARPAVVAAPAVDYPVYVPAARPAVVSAAAVAAAAVAAEYPVYVPAARPAVVAAPVPQVVAQVVAPQPVAPAAAPVAEEEPTEAELQMRERVARIKSETPGQQYIPRRVYVGGMPFSYEEDSIREYWSFCGPIEDLEVLRFPDTGRFKGIAFITFMDDEGYQNALDCHGSELDSQSLKVDKCKAPSAKRKEATAASPLQTAPAQKVPGYHVAYVGNIAFDADDAKLREVFEDCSILFVRLHTDKASGRSKGFAHAHFPDAESLDRAVAKDGMDLLGRNLKISFAQPKKN